MSFDPQRLFELLPVIYRVRDAEGAGGSKDVLRSLIDVIGGQVAVLEEDLAQLYDDQFIETCAEWVAPYIGDLIGYRTLYSRTEKIGSPRAEVANTIAYRRRKGTASMLEQLTRDVTEWDARAVEFFQLLATTQYMNHIRPQCAAAPDLRRWEALEQVGTAFDPVMRTIDVRRIARGRLDRPSTRISSRTPRRCPNRRASAPSIHPRFRICSAYWIAVAVRTAMPTRRSPRSCSRTG